MSENLCITCGGYVTHGIECDCAGAIKSLAQLMKDELYANRAKGGRHGNKDRHGWLQPDCSPEWLLGELWDHAAKLNIAAKELIRERDGGRGRDTPWGKDYAGRVREFGADVANVVLLLLDNLGLLVCSCACHTSGLNEGPCGCKPHV